MKMILGFGLLMLSFHAQAWEYTSYVYGQGSQHIQIKNDPSGVKFSLCERNKSCDEIGMVKRENLRELAVKALLRERRRAFIQGTHEDFAVLAKIKGTFGSHSQFGLGLISEEQREATESLIVVTWVSVEDEEVLFVFPAVSFSVKSEDPRRQSPETKDINEILLAEYPVLTTPVSGLVTQIRDTLKLISTPSNKSNSLNNPNP